jgi:hypothetical protein
MYLTDHEGKSAANDNRKFWERKLNKVLGGEEGCEREDIPSFLTPDADRGVVYSDEIIEMKGKLTLHMAQDPPHILYANDTFVHNTGTVRIKPVHATKNSFLLLVFVLFLLLLPSLLFDRIELCRECFMSRFLLYKQISTLLHIFFTSSTIPYLTLPYHTIPYHTIPYHTIPYHTIPYHTIPYHTIPYHTLPYHTFLHLT